MYTELCNVICFWTLHDGRLTTDPRRNISRGAFAIRHRTVVVHRKPRLYTRERGLLLLSDGCDRFADATAAVKPARCNDIKLLFCLFVEDGVVQRRPTAHTSCTHDPTGYPAGWNYVIFPDKNHVSPGSFNIFIVSAAVVHARRPRRSGAINHGEPSGFFFFCFALPRHRAPTPPTPPPSLPINYHFLYARREARRPCDKGINNYRRRLWNAIKRIKANERPRRAIILRCIY